MAYTAIACPVGLICMTVQGPHLLMIMTAAATWGCITHLASHMGTVSCCWLFVALGGHAHTNMHTNFLDKGMPGLIN